MMPRICALAGLLFSFALFTSVAQAEDSAVANAKARVEAARKVYEGRWARLPVDLNWRFDIDKDYQWSRRWLEAEREVSDKKADQIAAAEGHLDRMKKEEAYVKDQVSSGVGSPVDLSAAKFYRLEAEHILAQIRKK